MTMSCILHSFLDRSDQELEIRVAEMKPENKHQTYWVAFHIGPVSLATDNPELLRLIAVEALRYAQKLNDEQAAARAANPHADKGIVELLDEMKAVPLS